MKLLVLSHDDVVALLPMDVCIALMRETLAGLARGDSFQPLRSLIGAPCVCVDLESVRFGAHRRRTSLARPSRTRMRPVPSGGPGGRNRPQEEAPRRAAQ